MVVYFDKEPLPPVFFSYLPGANTVSMNILTLKSSTTLPQLYYLFYLMSVLNQNTIKNF